MSTTPEETGPHPLASRLAAYLQRPDDPDTLALAEAHLPIVESFVHGYTRGRGWDEGTGRPAAPLESVIISATARLTANPEQVSAYAVGDYSERPAALAGWTLPELAVLHRYRRRTNRGTTAKEADAVQQLNAELLAPYAKTTDVVESLSSYATLADLVSLVTEAELAAALDALPAPPDLSGYALKTDIPEEPDLSGYALKSDVPPAPDLSGYALKSEIPAEPDLTPYATKAGVPGLVGLRRTPESYKIPAGGTVTIPHEHITTSGTIFMAIDGNSPMPIWFQMYRSGTYNSVKLAVPQANPSWYTGDTARPTGGAWHIWVEGNGPNAPLMLGNNGTYPRTVRFYWFEL